MITSPVRSLLLPSHPPTTKRDPLKAAAATPDLGEAMSLTCNVEMISSLLKMATHLLPPASPWVEPLHRLELVGSVEAAHHVDLPSKGHSCSIRPALLLNKDIGQ